MKPSKITESQIVFAINQAETRMQVAEVCHKMGIIEAMNYNWNRNMVVPGSRNCAGSPTWKRRNHGSDPRRYP